MSTETKKAEPKIETYNSVHSTISDVADYLKEFDFHMDHVGIIAVNFVWQKHLDGYVLSITTEEIDYSDFLK